MGKLDDLEKLAKLKKDGVITEDEFNEEKKKIFGHKEEVNREEKKDSSNSFINMLSILSIVLVISAIFGGSIIGFFILLFPVGILGIILSVAVKNATTKWILFIILSILIGFGFRILIGVGSFLTQTEEQSDYVSEYNTCRDQAYDALTTRWNTTCKTNKKADNCDLAWDVATQYNKTYQADIDLCVERFAGKIENSEYDYEQCKNSAQTTYNDEWNAECKLLKLKNDCQLPGFRSEYLDEKLKNENLRCLKIYQQ